MVMEDGRCLLDVINDPQALNEFMQNDDLSGNGQVQEANTVGGTQHAFVASPVQNSNQSINESQGNVVMATGTMATSYGHLVQKTTQSIAPHQGQNVLQLATGQAFGSGATMQPFQVPQGAVLSQGNVVVQPGSFVQGAVSNGSSGSQVTPAPNRTLQPQFSSLARTQIVQQNTPQQRHAAAQQPSSFQAAFEKAMLANKTKSRQPQSQQAVAQQPNLNPPILQQNSPQQVLQQPISQQHLQQAFSQQPLGQNISQQSVQQNISQQSVQQNISQQSGVVQTMNSGSLQQNVVGQGGTKTISSLQALHNLNIVSHPSVQSSSISMAMPTVSTATVASAGPRTVHIQPKPPVAISPKLLPASSRPLVNISPKTSLPGSQTVLLQGANAQGVAPNINIANLVTLPGLRAPQGVLVQAQSLAQRISNVQRVPITTTTQANVTPPPPQQQQQQQTASPQTNILLQAAQQSNLMPSGPVQNVMPTNSGVPQGNVLQQHGVTLVQRASPGVAQQQQSPVTQHTLPVQIAPQAGNLQGQAPVYITSQSSPSPSNLQPAQAQQLRPVTSQQQQQQQQPSSNTSRTNLAALSIAQQIQDQAAAQSRSGQAAIIPQNLLQKGAKILPANVAQQLLQQRKLSDQPQGGTASPQIVAVNTSQPASTVTTVTMTTVQTTAVQHSVTTTSSQPQVLVTTGAGGQPRLIVTLPQQPLPPQFQQREEKNMQLYQQALRIQKERQLQPGVSASGQIAGTTIVTTQVQSGQQQGLLVQQQGMMGLQQGMMGQQVTSAGSQQTIHLSTSGQGSAVQNFLGQQVLSGVVQQHGIMGQQQGIVGQQQGIVGQQQGIVGQQQGIGGQVQQSIVGQQQGIVGQQQGIVGQQQGIGGQLQQSIMGQQQQGVMNQQLQGIMGQQQSMVGQQQQQGTMGQQQGTMGQQQQGMVVQQTQRRLGQQQQGIMGQQQQGILGQQQQTTVGQQQQGIMGQQQQGIVGQQQQLNLATPPQGTSGQPSPAKPVVPRAIAVSSPQQPIVTRAAAGQTQGSAQNPTGVTVVRQPVTLNVQQGKQFITLTLQQQQHLAAIQAKLRTIVTPGKQLSPQEKQVVQQLQVLQSRILQQAKAQTQALAQNAAGQASLAQAAQKMTPIAQKPAAPASTQAQGQGTIQQQRQQLNELLKTQTQVIRTTQGSGVTSVVSGSTSGAAGQPTLVKLQPQGAQGPAAVIQLTPQQKATLQQIQQQLKTLSPQQQQQFLKQQQHLILQLKNSKIAISPAALSAANAGTAATGVAGQQQLVTVLKQQPVQTIAGKLVQSVGIKRPAPQPLSKSDLIKNRGKLDQQGCLKPDYKTPFRNKEDAIKRLLPFHIHMTRDIEDKEIDKAEVTLDTVSQSLVEKYHKMRDKYHHLLLQESMRTDPSAEMVMLWRIFVHEEKSALAQEKKLAVEGANGTPVAAPSPSTSQEPAEPPAAALPVVGTATTAYLQPTAPTNTFPKSAATVTTSRSLATASSVSKPHTKTVTQDPLIVQGRTAATKVAVPVARGVAVAMETKEPSDEESEDEVDMADTVGASQPAMSYLNIDSSSMIEAVKATSPARLKSESEMAVASLLGEDSVDIDILNSDIANSDLPEDPGVDAVRSLTGALSPTRRNLNLAAAANDFEDDSDEEPDSLNEQVQSAINSILELQGRGPLDEEDSPQDVFNPFSQDPPCSTSSEQNIDEDNALDEAVKSILF